MKKGQPHPLPPDIKSNIATRDYICVATIGTVGLLLFLTAKAYFESRPYLNLLLWALAVSTASAILMVHHQIRQILKLYETGIPVTAIVGISIKGLKTPTRPLGDYKRLLTYSYEIDYRQYQKTRLIINSPFAQRGLKPGQKLRILVDPNNHDRSIIKQHFIEN